MEREPSGTSRRNSKGFGLQSLMECTLPQGQGSSDQEPSVEICAQGTCQHLLCKEGNRDNQRGNSSFLDMGIKPISHAQAMARGSEGDRSCRELMPFLDQLSPTRSQPTTLGTKRKESLVLEGSSHLSCVLLESN
ncbi:unnamed protein product [Microthlaspi erraticum]|uniref:Uncharacterized protein n=1 Tax=Microthlaspi erraticum TaxID=1685480 RepID=A0A6D2JCV0_9BRAS|nr:unnamed protein product [Microthlaspi erraticum]